MLTSLSSLTRPEGSGWESRRVNLKSPGPLSFLRPQHRNKLVEGPYIYSVLMNVELNRQASKQENYRFTDFKININQAGAFSRANKINNQERGSLCCCDLAFPKIHLLIYSL